jgi:hypothetical protein
MSRYFVLAYKRSEGRLVEPVHESGALAQAAEQRRAWEDKYRDHYDDVEVVVLTAPNLDNIKRTHARYFKTAAELTG